MRPMRVGGLKLRPRRSTALPCGALVLGSPEKHENENARNVLRIENRKKIDMPS